VLPPTGTTRAQPRVLEREAHTRKAPAIVRSLGALLVLQGVLTSLAPAACRGGHSNNVREAGEQCDGADTGPYVCQHFCMSSGSVSCSSDCTINTTACQGCGNARIDPGEVCDGTLLGGGSCPQGGTIACAADCRTWDTRGCFACRNGRREGAEQCDGPDLGGATCNRPGDTGGQPSCTLDCALDYDSCHHCPNGRVDPGEQCDDGNATPLDGCGPDCRLECGNGTVERWEECDDGNLVAGDGCQHCGLEQIYRGGGGEPLECALHWGVSGPPAVGPSVACTDGAACDRDGAVNGACGIRLFYCFNRNELVGGGSPACAPTDVARVELTGQSVSGPAALGPAGQSAVLDAMSASLTRVGSTVVRSGVRLEVTPAAAAPQVCGLFVLTVPAASDRAVSIRATDSASATDHDVLTLRCERP
jgi:cysteine-rich repeat protein